MEYQDTLPPDTSQSGTLAAAVKSEDGEDPHASYHKESSDPDGLIRGEKAVLTHSTASRASLQQIIDALPEAIQIVDARGRYILSNPASLDLVGFNVVGTRLPKTDQEAFDVFGLRRLDGTPCPVEDLPLQWTLRHGKPRRGVQILMRNAGNGHSFPILANSVPLYDAAGTLSGAMVVFQDISPIRELEKRQQDLVPLVSHDLKDTLTAITAHVQLLHRHASRLADPEARKILDGLQTLNRTAHRMARQIGELSDSASLRTDWHLKLDLLPTDLVALVEYLCVEYQQTTEYHLIRFESDAVPLLIHGDRPRLERAVANLLSNALKFSPDGGEILVCLHALPHPQQPDSVQAVLTVTDQGIGIPAEEVSHVSRGFFRGSNVVGAIPGTGRGLYGARQIVEGHDGTFDIASALGTGTTVTLRIPLVKPPAIPGA